jgi:ABC-type ATPase involved in cell division
MRGIVAATPHACCLSRHPPSPHHPPPRPFFPQALLGPSGAGKSTLMDMLAQRKCTGRLLGVLLVNGEAPTADFVHLCSYVPQYDNFVPVMTTLEVMQFYAGIILPRTWAASRRAARVSEVLQEMGLAHAQRTLVGGQSPGGLLIRGLSGGERKRLSIAAGVIAAPSVVFLDEPTTGLDSFAALTVGAAPARGAAGREAAQQPRSSRRAGGALIRSSARQPQPMRLSAEQASSGAWFPFQLFPPSPPLSACCLPLARSWVTSSAWRATAGTWSSRPSTSRAPRSGPCLTRWGPSGVKARRPLAPALWWSRAPHSVVNLEARALWHSTQEGAPAGETPPGRRLPYSPLEPPPSPVPVPARPAPRPAASPRPPIR